MICKQTPGKIGIKAEINRIGLTIGRRTKPYKGAQDNT